MSDEQQLAPILCVEILGDQADEVYEGRRVDAVAVTAADASKRRLRVVSKMGVDVAIDLPRGAFLRDGAVLADDGERLIAVSRTPEEVMCVKIGRHLDADSRVAAALRVGHAFGNQHVPVEVVGEELFVPLTTSRDVATRTLERLQLEGVEARFELRALACERPLAGHAHPH